MINLTDTFRNQRHLDSVVEEYYKKIGKWIEEKIDASLEINTGNEFLKFLKCNLKTIITGKPTELIKLYDEIESLDFSVLIKKTKIRIRKKVQDETIKKFLEYAFDYNKFRDGDVGKWFAEQLNIKTCVYCNTQFAHILKRTDKVEVAYQFDHFYPKGMYPYFALSFYNLIPSCGTCNNRKDSKDKSALAKDKPLLPFHPYIHDFDKEAVFSVDEESVIDFILT